MYIYIYIYCMRILSYACISNICTSVLLIAGFFMCPVDQILSHFRNMMIEVSRLLPIREGTTANEPLITLKGIRERVAKSPKSLPLVCTTKTGGAAAPWLSSCCTREDQSKALMPIHSTRTKDKASSRVSANLQADNWKPLALGLHEISTIETPGPLDMGMSLFR